MRASVIAVLAALALCVGAVEAATLKVPSQYATIALAEAAASNGDTIAIFRGRYKENIVSAKSLNFFGVPGTIWDGNIGGVNGAQLNVTGANVNIRNIEFQNGTDAVTITGANAKVANCSFRGCASDAVAIMGTTATVSGCRFTGLDYDTMTIIGANATVTRNVIQRGNGGQIRIIGANPLISSNVQDGINDRGIYVTGPANNARILNNRLSNIEADGINVTGNDVTVSNNRMTNLGPYCDYGIYVSGERATVSRNTMDGVYYYDNDAAGIWVEGGDGHRVTNNRVLGVVGGEDDDADGIDVYGSGVVVSGNFVDTVQGEAGAWGIYVDAQTWPNPYGPATVSNNTVLHVVTTFDSEDGYGIEVFAEPPTVKNNRVVGVSGYDGEPLYVSGDDAVVTGNRISDAVGLGDSSGDGYGIQMYGDRATVSRNVITRCSGDDNAYGIYLSGDDATVSLNRVDHINGDGSYGVYLSGDNATLDRNTVHDVNAWGYGIYVSGDDFTVTNNRVWNMGYSTDGIIVNGSAVSGTALIQGNRVWDCQDNGFGLWVTGATIRRNTALRCGDSGSGYGFYIFGNTNMVTRNTARAIGGDGFNVVGNTNTLYRDTAMLCDKDGFDLSSGTGNTLDRCRASRCAGEGLDNGATASVVTNNSLHRNRIDVANNGTITTFTGNSYTTGGTTTPQEVD